MEFIQQKSLCSHSMHIYALAGFGYTGSQLIGNISLLGFVDGSNNKKTIQHHNFLSRTL